MQNQTVKEGSKIKKQSANLRKNDVFGKSIKIPMNKFNVKIVIIVLIILC